MGFKNRDVIDDIFDSGIAIHILCSWEKLRILIEAIFIQLIPGTVKKFELNLFFNSMYVVEETTGTGCVILKQSFHSLFCFDGFCNCVKDMLLGNWDMGNLFHRYAVLYPVCHWHGRFLEEDKDALI